MVESSRYQTEDGKPPRGGKRLGRKTSLGRGFSFDPKTAPPRDIEAHRECKSVEELVKHFHKTLLCSRLEENWLWKKVRCGGAQGKGKARGERELKIEPFSKS